MRCYCRQAIGALLCCSLAVMTPSPRAMAQGSEDLEQFRQRVRAGKQLYDQKKYRAAIEEFAAARAIHDHPRLTFNIAQAYRALNECSKAKEAFARYLADPDADETMKERARDLRAKVDHDCVETGKIELRCNPPTAHVRLDPAMDESSRGQSIEGDCSLKRQLATGRWRLHASAEGHEDVTRDIEIQAKTTRVIDLSLPERREKTDSRPTPETETFDISADEIIGYSAVAVGTAILAGGLVSDLSTSGRMERMQEASSADELNSLEGEAESARTRTIILYAAGATATAGGVAWLIWTANDDADTSSVSSPSAAISVGLRRATLRFVF